MGADASHPGGLSTLQIARAFLVPEATLAQRIVLAKRRIARAGIPLEVPPESALAARLSDVLSVVHLIFNEGYLGTSGDDALLRDLTREAVRLGRALAGLMADEPEPTGLLALMLLTDARHSTRLTPDGAIVPLEEQDRSRWDVGSAREGAELVGTAHRRGRVGPCQVQAAIAALHVTAPTFAETDWAQIVLLHRELMRLAPTPVVALNAAVASGMALGPEHGLRALAALAGDARSAGVPSEYHPWLACNADLLRRPGRPGDALPWYRRARALAPTGAERAYLARRVAECERGLR